MDAFFILVGILVAYRIGYEVAHYDVAKECERLGSFYVGDRVFRCTKIEGPRKEQSEPTI